MSQPDAINAENFPMTRFWAIFSTQSISLLGSQIVQFSLVWWLTKTSGSASVLAIASIMALLPQVFISPIAGAYVDRWNRRLTMIAADSLIAIMVIIMALLSTFGLIQVWHIYTLMFLRAVGGAFHFPAMQASTTLMVKKDNFARVAGLTQALNGLVSILAPAFGAILYEVWPLQSVLMIDVATASIAIMILAFTKIPQPEKIQESKSLLSDVREGVNYLLHWRGGLYLILGAVLINLFFVPAVSLTAILVQRFFAGEALQFATLQSTLGIGMVVGGVSLGVWGGFKSKVKTAMIALVLAGLGSLIVGILPSSGFLLAIACFFVIGATLPLVNGSLLALLQAMIPHDLQGRVFTIVMATSTAMAPIGLAVAGPVSDLFGVQIWFIFGGLVMAGFGILSFFVPSMRDMEKIHESVKHDSGDARGVEA